VSETGLNLSRKSLRSPLCGSPSMLKAALQGAQRHARWLSPEALQRSTPFRPMHPQGRNPGTRNPKSGTRNPKPETRNPKLGTWNPEPGTRNPEPETRNPKPETLKLEARTLWGCIPGGLMEYLSLTGYHHARLEGGGDFFNRI
jgi:hypothetical protein